MTGGRTAEDQFNETNCLVCLESLTAPVTINCGHCFCRDCLTWWESNVNTSCPPGNHLEKKYPARIMFKFASLSVLVLLLGMLLTWKNMQDSSNELALYGTNQPSDPGKPEENPFHWLGFVFDSFFKFHTEELSLHGLLKSRNRLQKRRQLLELLDKCLVYVMEALEHEPDNLWENARLTLHCDSTLLVFVSGKGGNEMAMYEFDGKIYYRAKASSWQTFLTRAFRRYLW